MSLGTRLRETRAARGLTQRELAKLAGVRVATISEIERGMHKGVNTELAKKLARVLGVSIDHLVGTWEPDEGELCPAAVAEVGAWHHGGSAVCSWWSTPKSIPTHGSPDSWESSCDSLASPLRVSWSARW